MSSSLRQCIATAPFRRRSHFEAGGPSGYGHDAGDAVLREFAARVRRNIRGIDLACGLGGEEFVVVMPDTDLAKAALSVSGGGKAHLLLGRGAHQYFVDQHL
ncbi:MAG: diguanylate cyclase [Methylibium sp.]